MRVMDVRHACLTDGSMKLIKLIRIILFLSMFLHYPVCRDRIALRMVEFEKMNVPGCVAAPLGCAIATRLCAVVKAFNTQ